MYNRKKRSERGRKERCLHVLINDRIDKNSGDSTSDNDVRMRRTMTINTILLLPMGQTTNRHAYNNSNASKNATLIQY